LLVIVATIAVMWHAAPNIMHSHTHAHLHKHTRTHRVTNTIEKKTSRACV